MQKPVTKHIKILRGWNARILFDKTYVCPPPSQSLMRLGKKADYSNVIMSDRPLPLQGRRRRRCSVLLRRPLTTIEEGKGRTSLPPSPFLLSRRVAPLVARARGGREERRVSVSPPEKGKWHLGLGKFNTLPIPLALSRGSESTNF